MLTHLYSGKVRELYQTDDGVLLLVASDRISAFDYVLDTPIPDKGKILTQLSLWWFDRLADIVPNHVVDAPVPAEFAGRAMACMPLRMVRSECVARGYLAGSGLAEYRRDGRICGIALPPGLQDGSRLPEPMFTPATKAPQGEHDENITFDQLAAEAGAGPRGRAARDHAGGLRARRASWRPSAGSSWPTPRSSSASTPTARSGWPTRC